MKSGCRQGWELTYQLGTAKQEAIFDRTARRVYQLPEPESPQRDMTLST